MDIFSPINSFFNNIFSPIEEAFLSLMIWLRDIIFTDVSIIADSFFSFPRWVLVILFIVIVLDIILIVMNLHFGGKLQDELAINNKRIEESFARNTHRSIQTPNNIAWKNVLSFFSSHDPTHWRLGIIEADNLLDRVTSEQGHIGSTLGERLKNMPRNHFPEIDSAWAAHKVRNLITHKGDNFHLSARDAHNTMHLYERFLRSINAI